MTKKSDYPFTLTLFTNNPLLAREADAAGVDRIGTDLESLGKDQRQGHLNTWISDHTEADLPDLCANLTHAHLFARCNPPHAELSGEIHHLLSLGVKVIMLPYFHNLEAVHCFVDAVAGRAGDNDLPIPSELVYAQLARLGATGSLISRVFFRGWNHDFCKEIELAKLYLRYFSTMPPSWLQEKQEELRQRL